MSAVDAKAPVLPVNTPLVVVLIGVFRPTPTCCLVGAFAPTLQCHLRLSGFREDITLHVEWDGTIIG